MGMGGEASRSRTVRPGTVSVTARERLGAASEEIPPCGEIEQLRPDHRAVSTCAHCGTGRLKHTLLADPTLPPCRMYSVVTSSQPSRPCPASHSLNAPSFSPSDDTMSQYCCQRCALGFDP